MRANQACYRELKHRYKYQLTHEYAVQIPINPPTDILTEYVDLLASGNLCIKEHYAWDGPSGPTIDTRNFMRGSLVHDALYQLMRERHLDHTVHRQVVDDLLRDICREDGMTRIRSWWVHKAVCRFGAKNGRLIPAPMPKTICVP